VARSGFFLKKSPASARFVFHGSFIAKEADFLTQIDGDVK
jgi:hypothetical protein